jgi:hypothetical protein
MQMDRSYQLVTGPSVVLTTGRRVAARAPGDREEGRLLD